MELTVGNREIKMKTRILLVMAVTLAFSVAAFAQKVTRIQLKCYIQLEDKAKIIHHFVSSNKDTVQFIAQLTGRTVFMADGVTKKKILAVYECVDSQNGFKNKAAVKLEKITPF